MPYKGRDKEIYNKGYYAGARYIMLRLLGGKCIVCNVSMSEKQLEIHETNGSDKHGEGQGRNYDDWIKGALTNTIELRCKEHHRQTEGWRNRKK